MEISLFLKNMRLAAKLLRENGCNTDVRVCAKEFGLDAPDAPDNDLVFQRIRELARPGALYSPVSLESLERIFEVYEHFRITRSAARQMFSEAASWRPLSA